MNGDFLPRRQSASALSQIVTVVILLTAAAVGVWMFV
ncbi:hypothetical protein JOF29_005799 [Kribbella aluminosa]|uniref:Uncharacterized protein n=1 Tax=Kribbella aluminosa TaxID=416017 RepID=A0ABS4USS7_9ACTN|nr:hypothetical protein [Kribbella aluminosa]